MAIHGSTFDTRPPQCRQGLLQNGWGNPGSGFSANIRVGPKIYIAFNDPGSIERIVGAARKGCSFLGRLNLG